MGEKETLMKYMGEKSGIYGILFSLLLGGIAAGPLYVAFPIAALLLKKVQAFGTSYFS